MILKSSSNCSAPHARGPASCTNIARQSSTRHLCPRQMNNCSDDVQMTLELFNYSWILQRLVLDDGHVDEPGQMELGGDGHGVGRPVPVLGHDEVRLARAR